MKKERYDNLDGVRAYACIGIILMHVIANGSFGLKGFFFEKAIPSFTNFTYLFMVLSAFSMCCGYYERFASGNADLEKYYIRRYKRIWPYFALLCTIELIVEHSLKSLYEWFADLTLTFGLIPHNNIKVVGVGWFLGTVFVFYMVFPFFVFLMKNKRRAWFVLIIAVLLNLLCTIHFTETGGRVNIIYSSMFFVAGGIIYLHRDKLDKIKLPTLAVLIVSLAIYYILNNSEIVMVVVFASIAIVSISFDNKLTKGIFQNRPIRYLGSISMEVYLCHMFVFRVMEKINITHITQNQLLNYVIVSIATIAGAIVMAYILQKLIAIIQKKVIKVV